MYKPARFILLAAGFCAATLAVRADDTTFSDPVSGQDGWTEIEPDFKVQSPYNLPQGQRYTEDGGVYHMVVMNNDEPFGKGNTTKPRTEQRFEPDYTSGKVYYAADLMVPQGTSNVCVMQIHTGNEQSHQFGATTFMLFFMSDGGGSLHLYSSKPLLAGNLYDKWFHLSVLHDVPGQTITAWVDGKEIIVHKANASPDFYIKDGVYSQKGASPKMEVYIKNIKMWKHE
jgi:hypothetical protein